MLIKEGTTRVPCHFTVRRIFSDSANVSLGDLWQLVHAVDGSVIPLDRPLILIASTPSERKMLDALKLRWTISDFVVGGKR